MDWPSKRLSVSCRTIAGNYIPSSIVLGVFFPLFRRRNKSLLNGLLDERVHNRDGQLWCGV